MLQSNQLIGFGARFSSFAGPWTPAVIPGSAVYAWYDAIDAGNFTLTGSTVNQWNDLSANGFHLTRIGAAGTEPTRETVADFGSLNAVKFDGVDDGLQYVTPGTLAQPYTVCAIVRTGSVIDDLEIFFESAASAGCTLTFKWSGVSNKPHAFASNAVARHNTVLSTSTPYLDITTMDGASSSTRINGNTSSPTTFDPGTNAAQDILLGGTNRAGGFASFTGHYGAFILVNRALTTDERDKMEGYLAWRFGRQGDLPGGHPYSGSPP